MLSTQRKCVGIQVEAGLIKNHIVSRNEIDRLIDDFSGTVLFVPFFPYHFVHTILSNDILSNDI